MLYVYLLNLCVATLKILQILLDNRANRQKKILAMAPSSSGNEHGGTVNQ